MHHSDRSQADLQPSASAPYRRLLLALVGIGAIGLLLELVLLEHFEDPWQWAPVITLGLAVVVTGLVAVRASRGTLRLFQVVMLACVVFGAVGVYLHLDGNIQWELESTPALSGWPLYREAVRGAVPMLAPGALAQLGLLGLLFTYRHPAVAPTHQEPA